MNVSHAIRAKHAVRQYTDQPISDEDVRAILDAGRRAQSSKNTQPWTFIAVRERDRLKRLSQAGNYAGHVARAALAVAIVAQGDNEFDLGQAAAYMQLAALERGIGSCITWMHHHEQARQALGVPPDHDCHYVLAFGYPAPNQQRPAAVRPGGRKPLEEVVRWEKW